ncbi:MFS general substrate transporter [Acaromyces ingoldii]|uniref:MFS general substrate transporter n=1 Tax=Acaromyces ingoldii TaxID=215250 RepID=A0A316YJK5_9BASI|nr:MFS general substrate transporter [Acaromyces ingoldii]PWN88994.1 MFS general substrate transporter [Acaromyces ingoldii]
MQLAPPLLSLDGPSTSPKDWSSWRKTSSICTLIVMTFALTATSTSYSSSARHIMSDLHMSQELFVLGISLFVLGFGVGPLIFGPLAQAFGKRPVYFFSYVLFTAFCFGCSEANNSASLLCCRFFAGSFGSTTLFLTPGSINELVEPRHQNRVACFYAFAAFLGPSVGTCISSFVDEGTSSWRWNLRVMAIFVGFTTLLCFFFVEETSYPTSLKTISWRRTIISPFVILFKDPVVFLTSFYLALLYGYMYAFFALFPLVFGEIRHFSPTSLGLIYLSLLVGGLEYYVKRKYLDKKLQPPPEARLVQGLWATFLPAFGLFIFAWTAPFPSVHWIGASVGMFVFLLGAYISFICLIPYLVIYSGPQATAALTAVMVTRAAFATGWPLVVRQMCDKMTVQGASSFLAGLTLLMVPLIWVLYLKGAQLRARKLDETSGPNGPLRSAVENSEVASSATVKEEAA